MRSVLGKPNWPSGSTPENGKKISITKPRPVLQIRHPFYAMTKLPPKIMRLICQLYIFLFIVAGLVASQGQDGCVGCAIEDFLWNGVLGGFGILRGFFDEGEQEQQQKLGEDIQQGIDQDPLPAVQRPLEIFVTSPKECEGKEAGVKFIYNGVLHLSHLVIDRGQFQLRYSYTPNYMAVIRMPK